MPKKKKLSLDAVAGGAIVQNVGSKDKGISIHAEPVRDFSKWDMFLFDEKKKK